MADKSSLPKPIVNFPLKNTVPANSFGPYFKEIDVTALLRARQREVPFRTSSLEKKHVWKPHFAADLGLKLDLVNQEAYLNDAEPPAVHPEDRKLYTGGAHAAVDTKAKTKSRAAIDTASQPWFFRQTTYMENNPFNPINKFSAAEDKAPLASKRKLVDASKDIFSQAFIDKSFALAESTVDKLVKENSGKRKLLWSKPLLPREEPNAQRSIVRFDEDPSLSAGYTTNTSGDAEKRFRIDRSVLMNERAVTVDASKCSIQTLVAPSADDDSRLQWVKDYEKDVKDLPSSFVILLSDDSEPAVYLEVSHRIEMKRVPLEQSTPHDCTILRTEEVH